jgi:tRNA 2-thiouridine synthesizing protein A
MTADSKPLILDARGHKCPVPTLKLRRAVESVPENIHIELWADDPMAQIDIPHFCQGHSLPAPEIIPVIVPVDDAASLNPPSYWRFIIRGQS